ncbi:MAG TPA: hypothetical protein VHM67_13660, partial [Gemmatimonadaceae bacterium]|nr:hypothetical protein [Gemmatimonadaceae bacterium]
MRRLLATPLVACALVLPAAGCSAQRPAAAATAPAPAVVGRPITFDDFATIPLVSDPQLSPDGSRVLYAVRTTDIDANRRTTRTFVVALDGRSTPTQFPDAQTNASEARWSPDGTRVAFASGGQLWVADASGANKRQLTTLNGGATGPVWAPTSDRIAFTSGVYPDCKDDACNVGQDSVRNASKVKAFIADNLLYRHWTQYDPGTRSHLYVVPASGGAVRDLMPGAVFETPVGPFGGSEQYAWSPDGRELAFSAKDQARASAWTTDVNLYLVPADGSGAPAVVTAGNAGADQNPVYTPDGRYIAYQSQARGGYESDRWRIMLFDRSARTSRELLPSFDRNADAYLFAPDMRTLYVAAQDRGRDKLYRFTLGSGLAAGPAQVVVSDWNNTAFSFSRDLRTLAWSRDAGHRPPEVYVSRLTG